MCGRFQTLLADADGVYDPTDHNDRLLLGLTGIMSEAELHILKERMHQGKLNKARRGELLGPPPIGYLKRGKSELLIDPDEQVQAVVRLIFDQFDQQGTLQGLLRYLVRHHIRLPVRPHGGPHAISCNGIGHAARRCRTCSIIRSMPVPIGTGIARPIRVGNNRGDRARADGFAKPKSAKY